MPRFKVAMSSISVPKMASWFIGLIVVSGGAILSGFFWKVTKIECQLQGVACPEQVSQVLSPLMNTPLLWFNHQTQAAELLVPHGYQLQTLRRQLPATLTVTVLQQPAVLQVKLDDTHWAVINQQLNYIFSDQPLDVPTVQISPEQLGDRQLISRLAELFAALQQAEIPTTSVEQTAEAVIISLPDAKQALLPLDQPASQVPRLKLLLDANSQLEDQNIKEYDLRFALPVLRTQATSSSNAPR